jgi:hypothetical protein
MFKKTLTMDQITSMTKEELDRESKKLLVKIVVYRLILPMAAIAVTHLVIKKLDKDN